MESEHTLTLEDFFFNTPIYTVINIDDSNNSTLEEILGNGNIIEGYNPIRNKQSTFETRTFWSASYRGNKDSFIKDGGFRSLNIRCKRYDDLFYFYIFWEAQDNTLQKIGQYPSVADIHIGEIKQYNKLLSKEKLKEFTRAIGLAANGVGIGSFVYLRRIFESLIDEAKDIAVKKGAIEDEDFKTFRMEEKIENLSEYLPEFLIQNRKMYSILSKGVHELEEEECLQYFDTLRVGIEIILDEKLEEQKKNSKIDEAKKKLGAILGKEKSN